MLVEFSYFQLIKLYYSLVVSVDDRMQEDGDNGDYAGIIYPCIYGFQSYLFLTFSFRIAGSVILIPFNGYLLDNYGICKNLFLFGYFCESNLIVFSYFIVSIFGVGYGIITLFSNLQLQIVGFVLFALFDPFLFTGFFSNIKALSFNIHL